MNYVDFKELTGQTLIKILRGKEMNAPLKNEEPLHIDPAVSIKNSARTRDAFDLWRANRPHWADTHFEAYCAGLLDSKVNSEAIPEAKEAAMDSRSQVMEEYSFEIAGMDNELQLVQFEWDQPKNLYLASMCPFGDMVGNPSPRYQVYGETYEVAHGAMGAYLTANGGEWLKVFLLKI